MDIVGGQINGGAVDSFGDHRVAMAFAVAGARARGPVTIHNCEPILTSFPQFADQAVSLGLRLSERHEPHSSCSRTGIDIGRSEAVPVKGTVAAAVAEHTGLARALTVAQCIGRSPLRQTSGM
jgi:hypothetical protein